MKIIELADCQSQRDARDIREKLAGELDASYDALTDSYVYKRKETTRRLVIRDHETRKGGWLQVIIEVNEETA